MATQTHAGTRSRSAPGAPPRPEVDARVFWSWVWHSLYPALGWVLIGIGVLAIALGWWGVSRTPIVAKQLPYLASGGLLGVSLIALGGRFLVIQDLRRDSGRLDRLEQMVLELHQVLLTRIEQAGYPDAVEHDADTRGAARNGTARNGTPATYLTLPDGERFHREGCAVVEGKEGVSRIRSTTVARRGLQACPLCEPAAADV